MEVVAAFGTVIFTVIVPGAWTVVVPYLVLASDFRLAALHVGLWRFLGLIPMAFGVVMYVWCAWDFTFSGKGTPAPIAPPKELVVKGLYQYVRNPMYVGVVLILLGEALLFESAELLIYAGFSFALFHTWVVIYEEPTLRRQFTDAYERYCASVPRWIPSVRP